MNNHNEIHKKAFDTLKDLAVPHVPNGSDLIAVIDQWLHALATNSQPFCNPELTSPQTLKSTIKKTLKKNDLYTTREQFFDSIFADLALKPVKHPKFKFIDLFAGIGGVRLGFQENGGACVFSSEFDKHAQQTYKVNHGEMPFGDITKINAGHIPEHDVLLAGFPCQPFSHAGLKLGIDDTRGTLFHDIAQIIKLKKPKFVLLENVKGLISHDKGNTLKVILNTISNIGYDCNIPSNIIQSDSSETIKAHAKKMVLKSKDFGVPQNRQRIYIVLWQKGLIPSFEYPQPSHTSTSVSSILEESPDPKLTISDKLWAGHKRRKETNRKNGKGFGYGLVNRSSEYTNTISARYYKDGSEVLIAQEGKNPRKLSPLEASRLQGFPAQFICNSSNVQAYKQFGNSVSVPVIAAIAERISQHLTRK